MDQFTYAERATDWRGNNNIAESIFSQMAQERHPMPTWIVVGAGTGGTSATIGRYVRYRRHATRLCVVDPEDSAFFDGWANGDPAFTGRPPGSRASAGRASSRRSCRRSIDRMIQVPDAASIAAMRFVRGDDGPQRRRVDRAPTSGARCRLVAEMRARGERGSVVTLICDGGERYLDTYYDDAWVAGQGLELAPYSRRRSSTASPAASGTSPNRAHTNVRRTSAIDWTSSSEPSATEIMKS